MAAPVEVKLDDARRDFPAAWAQFCRWLPEIESEHERIHGETIKLGIATAQLRDDGEGLELYALAVDRIGLERNFSGADESEPYFCWLAQPVQLRTH